MNYLIILSSFVQVIVKYQNFPSYSYHVLFNSNTLWLIDTSLLKLHECLYTYKYIINTIIVLYNHFRSNPDLTNLQILSLFKIKYIKYTNIMNVMEPNTDNRMYNCQLSFSCHPVFTFSNCWKLLAYRKCFRDSISLER